MEDQSRISDERLFIRYAKGEGRAFRILVEKYAPRLLRFCRGYLRYEVEVEDAVQVIFRAGGGPAAGVRRRPAPGYSSGRSVEALLNSSGWSCPSQHDSSSTPSPSASRFT